MSIRNAGRWLNTPIPPSPTRRWVKMLNVALVALGSGLRNQRFSELEKRIAALEERR